MKPAAIVYVDMEETDVSLYNYRAPHAQAARQRGLAFICLARTGRAAGIADLARDADEIAYFSTLTAEDIVRAVHLLGERCDIKAIMCHAGHPTPYGLTGKIVADASERLGLIHTPSRALECANNKFLCRQTLKAAQVRTVDFAIANNEDEIVSAANDIGYPVIIKPPFGAGCLLVAKCNDEKELRANYRLAVARFADTFHVQFTGAAHDFVDVDGITRSYVPGQSFLVERYISGPEGCVEIAIVGDKVIPMLVQHKLKITEKASTIYEDLLITPPSAFSESQILEIKNYATSAVKAIGLTNAFVHLEFRYEAGVGPQVLEINPRLGGMYVDEAFRTIIGFDPFGAYLDILLNSVHPSDMEMRAQKTGSTPLYHTMFVIYPPKSGILVDIKGLEQVNRLPGVLKSAICYPIGTDLNAEDEEHFLVKVWGKSKDEVGVSALYDDVCKLIHIEMR